MSPLVDSADRLQRKVQELCRILRESSPHALISPTAAFLLAECQEEAFAVQKEIALAHKELQP
jgi:hypothetical protein